MADPLASAIEEGEKVLVSRDRCSDPECGECLKQVIPALTSLLAAARSAQERIATLKTVADAAKKMREAGCAAFRAENAKPRDAWIINATKNAESIALCEFDEAWAALAPAAGEEKLK